MKYSGEIITETNNINLIINKNGNIYNITRSEDRQWTLKDAAELAIKIAGKGDLIVADRDLSFPKRGRLSIMRAQRDLGYDPKVDPW